MSPRTAKTLFGVAVFVAGLIWSPAIVATGFPVAAWADADSSGDDVIDPAPAGSDYLIITHETFETAAVSLAEAKAAKGYLTKVITTAEIAEIPTAEQIASFIRSEYWTKAPQLQYVLLVGDVDYLPTHYRTPCTSCGSQTIFPTDLYYATMDDEDYLPDVFVGRLPVNTFREANALVAKILSYDPCTNGNRVLLFGAYPEATYADADAAILKREGFVTDKAYAPPADGQTVLDRINAGRLLVAYYGHGTVACFGDAFFCVPQLSQLTNTELPLMVSGGCATNNFAFDLYPSMGEQLVLSAAGAIASIGATRNGGGYGYEYKFTDGLYEELGLSARIGRMLHAGLRAAYEADAASGADVGMGSWTHTFVEQMNLLGDPELRLKLYCALPIISDLFERAVLALRQLEVDTMFAGVPPSHLEVALAHLDDGEEALQAGQIRKAEAKWRSAQRGVLQYETAVQHRARTGGVPPETVDGLLEDAGAIVGLVEELIGAL